MYTKVKHVRGAWCLGFYCIYFTSFVAATWVVFVTDWDLSITWKYGFLLEFFFFFNLVDSITDTDNNRYRQQVSFSLFSFKQIKITWLSSKKKKYIPKIGHLFFAGTMCNTYSVQSSVRECWSKEEGVVTEGSAPSYNSQRSTSFWWCCIVLEDTDLRYFWFIYTPGDRKNN